MATPAEAQALAQTAMQDYIALCQCDTEQDVANVLQLLIGMCGVGICAVVGYYEAVERMQNSTDYIASSQAGKTWKQGTVQ